MQAAIEALTAVPTAITRQLRPPRTLPRMSESGSALDAPVASPVAPLPPKSPRRLGAWIGVLAVGATAVVGSNMFGIRDHFFEPATPDAAAPASGRTAGSTTPGSTVAAAPTQLRSQPWWQDVTSVEGDGTMTASPFTIASGAVQWRVKGSCQSGRLVVKVPSQRKPLVDAPCTGEVTGFGSHPGPVQLQVTARGSWHLDVAQQIDIPLVEPPLPDMTAPGAAPIAGGPFYDIDKTVQGRMTLYREASGKYALRFDDFFVSPNADLQLRLSPLPAPKTSAEFQSQPSVLVTVMDVTAGSLNYEVPETIDPTKFQSVVIWCAPVNSAYAAASLGGVK